MIEIIQGDCREVLAGIQGVDAFVTDPPWPDRRIDTGWQGPEWWAGIVAQMTRIVGETGKIIVIASTDTDARPLCEPIRLPFVHACWMRYVPPHHHGPVLRSADIAYQFGRAFLPKGERIMPEECCSPSSRAGKQEKAYLNHPCPRNVGHIRWLLRTQVGAGRTVCDPFLGSGTTAVAAVLEGLDCIGIEIDARHHATAQRRVLAAQDQLSFVEAEQGQQELFA